MLFFVANRIMNKAKNRYFSWEIQLEQLWSRGGRPGKMREKRACPSGGQRNSMKPPAEGHRNAQFIEFWIEYYLLYICDGRNGYGSTGQGVYGQHERQTGGHDRRGGQPSGAIPLLVSKGAKVALCDRKTGSSWASRRLAGKLGSPARSWAPISSSMAGWGDHLPLPRDEVPYPPADCRPPAGPGGHQRTGGLSGAVPLPGER